MSMYTKVSQRTVLCWNRLYPIATPIKHPMNAMVLIKFRKGVHSVAIRRNTTTCKTIKSNATADQSHQRGEANDFCMGKVYIKYDRHIRYFGGVLSDGRKTRFMRNLSLIPLKKPIPSLSRATGNSKPDQLEASGRDELSRLLFRIKSRNKSNIWAYALI